MSVERETVRVHDAAMTESVAKEAVLRELDAVDLMVRARRSYPYTVHMVDQRVELLRAALIALLDARIEADVHGSRA